MAKISVAEQYYKEGKYWEACQLYDALLNEEPRNIQLLQGKTYCFLSLCNWNNCFETILKAFQLNNWNLSFLDNFIDNLVKELRARTQPDEVLSRTIEENLICECCHEVLSYPVTISCGHTFCRQCILKNKKCLSCNDKSVPGIHEKLEDRCVNIVLTNIVEKCFQAKIKAIQLRCEGNKCYISNTYKDALRKYKEALNLDPTNHLILGNMAHVYSILEEYQTALEYADQACKKMPNWEKGYYRKGEAYVGLKNYSQAAICFLKVLLINPQNSVARKSLSKVLIEILRLTTNVESQDRKNIDDLSSSLDNLIKNHQDEKQTKASYDEVTFLLTEKLSVTDLQCLLCCRMFYDPVTYSCGHTLCRWCLNRCLDHNPVCPVCRYPINEYIDTENQNVTTHIKAICKKYFPEKFQERKHQHDEEITKHASISTDTDEDIPIFVCTLAIPSVPCKLHIFEPRYRLMIRECMESGSKQFGMCCPSENDSYSNYGVMLEIINFQLLPDGRSLVESVGGRRFKVLIRGKKNGYNTAKVEWLKDEKLSDEERERIEIHQQFLYARIVDWFSSLSIITKIQLLSEKAIGLSPPKCDFENTNDRNGPTWIWWALQLLPIQPSSKLEIISITDIRQRLNKIEQYFQENVHTT